MKVPTLHGSAFNTKTYVGLGFCKLPFCIRFHMLQIFKDTGSFSFPVHAYLNCLNESPCMENFHLEDRENIRHIGGIVCRGWRAFSQTTFSPTITDTTHSLGYAHVTMGVNNDIYENGGFYHASKMPCK